MIPMRGEHVCFCRICRWIQYLQRALSVVEAGKVGGGTQCMGYAVAVLSSSPLTCSIDFLLEI